MIELGATQIYRKLNRIVILGAKSKKKHRDMEDQKKYLDRFGTPKDAYEKAYYKYLCHAYYHFSFLIRCIYNIAGLFAVPICLIIFYFKSRKKQFEDFTPHGAIIISSPTMDYRDILPDEIEERYGEIRPVRINSDMDRCLDKVAWKFYKKFLSRYWMHPYFCLEFLFRLAGICDLLYKYHPKALVGYVWERDFVCPILLEYCRAYGVDRISFMHGVFVYSIDKAYLSFTKYYVWEDYYIKMFTDLRADTDMLQVYTPKKYKINVKPRSSGKYDYFMSYYCASEETRESLNRIKTCFDIFKTKNLKCKLRPHPRMTDVTIKDFDEIFSGYVIEKYDECPIEQSLECSEYIAAFNSTVLTQAYYAGKKVVIDDNVFPDRFENMIDRNFIMLDRPHILMSELLKNECGVDIKQR